MLRVGAIDFLVSLEPYHPYRLEPSRREEKTEVAQKEAVRNQLPLPCKTGSNAVSQFVLHEQRKTATRIYQTIKTHVIIHPKYL